MGISWRRLDGRSWLGQQRGRSATRAEENNHSCDHKEASVRTNDLSGGFTMGYIAFLHKADRECPAGAAVPVVRHHLSPHLPGGIICRVDIGIAQPRDQF